jgi:hypothetical protein
VTLAEEGLFAMNKAKAERIAELEASIDQLLAERDALLAAAKFAHDELDGLDGALILFGMTATAGPITAIINELQTALSRIQGQGEYTCGGGE